MIKYRSYRIVDGKAKWTIVDDKGTIVDKSPNKDELKSTILHKPAITGHPKSYYNRTNACYRCETNFDNTKGNPSREYNKEGKWTGNWLCQNCWAKDDRKERRLTNFRTGNTIPNSSNAKGYIFEQITCKTRGVKSLNIENDNFNSPIDHSTDYELGIIQTKGAVLGKTFVNGHTYDVWCAKVKNEQGKEFDNLIFYCMSKDMGNIERVYIIPIIEIMKRETICIYRGSNLYKNPSHWYDVYIVDEKPYNIAYHNLDRDDLRLLKK